jgi:crotonobetainyl-CoA:carnitine CoA-transferase CaiB-like acyl-CoA transferase
MRITGSHIADFSTLHCDPNCGKWNRFLDLRKEEDCEKLRQFILVADVVVQDIDLMC